MIARRGFLVAAGGLSAGILVAALPSSARATPESMQEAIRSVTGDVPVRNGRVKLDLPPLIDNGNAVPMKVSVDSPMRENDYVRSIHVFAEKNPLPNVISVHLGPRAGRAEVTTRIRLADSQKVMALAEMSDGSWWSGSVEVVVTLSACLENLV